ncbi:hypothetical protein EAO71_33735 [Streptomyces sp. ms191]|uniref:hypothetical protein n=1 Tax=Streptomyces sp. ms191 TaxID=1827978 RepID=UPI0011CDD2E3|nr:hypothetical protein [Streptomyces sp. ms191]TXS19609.1 hypothetical protein EAO71_33735 [Streptomyces sp. ms191]
MAITGNFLSDSTSSMDPSISGWTAKLNSTLTKGTGGRVGDGTLSMKSVAAGEMQARTVASYPVIPLTEYEAFADASGATVPERIGIRWLTAASTEISISWSVTTTTASATWHRIAVADLAPATAAYAQVILSSMTPAAANVIGAFENAYLGLPFRTTGNLLSANTEGLERGTTGWLNELNCTLSRQTPMVQWAADWYLGGGHMLAMTVTGGGNASTRTTDFPQASPGVEYLGYAYLSPPTSVATTWVELRFYDGAFAQLAATQSVLAAPGTGVYRQRVSAVAPAGTVYAGLAAGITSGSAAQVLRVDNAVIMVAPKIREGSVVPYADSSFEQGVGGWTVASGVATLARVTPWGTDGLDGSYCMSVSSATATTSVIRSAKFPISGAGDAFTAEYGMKVQAGGWNLTRTIRWYDAANVDLGTSSTASAAVPSPNWWLLSVNGTAPANATQAAIEWTLTATATSSVLRVDKVSLWETLPQATVVGNDTDAYITVTLRELDTTSTVTVWRVRPDGSRTLVRGETGLIENKTLASSVLVIEDYEAPLGVSVYYYAETKNSSGVITGTRTTATVTLDPGDTEMAWLKDPGNPQRNLRVMVRRAPDWGRPISQTEFRVRGRRNSVIHSDVRGGLEGDLSVWTRTDQERAALHWILDSGNTLLWQAAPGMGVDDMYVNVGQAGEARPTDFAPELWRAWTLPLRQADMPVTVGITGSAGRTWQDILTENATWGDLLSKYATWEDVLFNRPIGG